MRNALAALLVLAVPFFSFPQDSFSKELSFANYLVSNEYFTEAAAQFELMEQRKWSAEQLDSLHFSAGWFNYLQEELYDAGRYFAKVSKHSPQHVQAVFFASMCYAYVGQDSLAEGVLINFETDEPKYIGLYNYQLAALALLRGDLDAFDTYAAKFNGAHYSYAGTEANLVKYRQSYQR